MATSSSNTKAKPENPNLTRTRSISRKPKQPSSVSSDDGSDLKPEKPLPNYLKPTFSSSPDPVKLVKKNNTILDDHQKLLRRKSFDRAPSSLPSASTSSSRIHKTLNASPSLTRDKPSVPRDKPATALRSSSFHGTRGVPRGGTTTAVKSPPVGQKKSGLSSSSGPSKSKKEVSENVKAKKVSEKEIALDTASLSSAQEEEEEILKVVEIDVKVADDIEEPKVENETKEVQVEAVHVDEPSQENEISHVPTLATASPVVEDIVVAKETEKEEEEQQLIKETETEEQLEETKEQENKIDETETSEKVDTDMNSKEPEVVVETTEEEVKEDEKVTEENEVKEEKQEEEEVKEEKKEEVKEETKEKVKEEEKKKEVVKAKKETPSAYNDVIASKMQENPRKNKVLALAGAFQTVIDYETAASK